MRSKRFHGLKRIKIRQTWNKYNLYNLSRQRALYVGPLTHYQQKWKAKALARGYHGEQIREKQWQQQFSSRLRSVAPMDHRYLAAFNGSEQAQGRGSGKEMTLEQRQKSRALDQVPYMQMTFAPTERRLDTAVFRSLFASSARQARQFVVHGAVRVNGEKMIYPGYLLNPGDMFQVDPDRVLFATGAPKNRNERQAGRELQRRVKSAAASTEKVSEERAPESFEESSNPSSTTSTDPPIHIEKSEAELRSSHKVKLKNLLDSAKTILGNKKDTPRAKQKQALRQLSANVRKALGSVNRTSLHALDDDLSNLLSQLKIVSAPPAESSKAGGNSRNDETENLTSDTTSQGLISHEDRMVLRESMRELRENPIDPSKPYATPWHPRPYMSAFAFIPRYLEVNQNVCSAVYLRHPVARPGLSEVPTPFDSATSQLAFTWYLRRR